MFVISKFVILLEKFSYLFRFMK